MSNTRAKNIETISDKLTQRTLLSKKDIGELQTALKNTGHNPGGIDGDIGENTGKAIESFLKTPEAERLLPRLSEQTIEIVDKHGKDPALMSTLAQANILCAELNNAIRYAIEEDTTPIIDNKDVKLALNTLGYTETPDGKNKQLAEGLKAYIKDNPDLEQPLTLRLQRAIENRFKEDTYPSKDNEHQLFGLSVLGYLENPDTKNNNQIAKALSNYLENTENETLFKKTSMQYYPYLVRYGQANSLNDLIESSGLLAERRKQIVEAIPLAAEAADIDPEMIEAMWGIESNCDRALASVTFCEGSFHYQDSTWNNAISKNAAEIAAAIRDAYPNGKYNNVASKIERNEQNIGALSEYQYHPIASVFTQAFFIRDNLDSLRLNTSNKENGPTAYLAHVMGNGDAIRILGLIKKGDQTPAATICERNATYNPRYFYEYDSKTRTFKTDENGNRIPITADKTLAEADRSYQVGLNNYNEFCGDLDRDIKRRQSIALAQKELAFPYSDKHLTVTPMSSEDDTEKRFALSWTDKTQNKVSPPEPEIPTPPPSSEKSILDTAINKEPPLQTTPEKDKLRSLIMNWDATKPDTNDPIGQNTRDITITGENEMPSSPRPEQIISPQNNF